jgi:hypothetical protein
MKNTHRLGQDHMHAKIPNSGNLNLPSEYQWLIKRGLVGFEPFTQLQPWYYIPLEQCFWATDKWPNVSTKRLFVFARRQDNDDFACLAFDEKQEVKSVLLIHGWTASGFDIIQEYLTFWHWMQQVIQDISEWAAPE